MLKFFRKHARGWFMMAFMGIIIFVFVLYFGTDQGSQTARAIAIIDGKVITENEFYNEYAKAIDMARAQHGDKLTADVIKEMGFKQATYDSLINRKVIIAKAADLNIQVSDDELIAVVMSMPDFQTDGLFDRGKYNQLLRFNKMTDEDFQTAQRITLAANKIETIIREGIKVSDAEIYELYALQNLEMNLSYLQVSGADLRKMVRPDREDLETYLRNNPGMFRVPEQLQIRYLLFAADDHVPPTLSESEIRDHYERTRGSYPGKEGQSLPYDAVRDRVAQDLKLIRGKQNAFNEAKKAHDTIYQENDFEDYAARKQLNPMLTEFFSVGNPPKPFANIPDLARHLTGLQKNDMTRVIASDTGYYLMKVADRKDAYTPKLDDIESAVLRIYTEIELSRQTSREAQAIIDEIRSGASMAEVAKAKGLKTADTGFFSIGGEIPGLGESQEALDIFWKLTPSTPLAEHPVFIGNRYVIFYLKDVREPDLVNFVEVKDLYGRALVAMRREEAMKAWMQGNRDELIREKRLKINRVAEDL